MISIIVAKALNNVIGYKGKIPWNIPADLKYFKSITKNGIVIMGRNTYESIGKPLSNRVNIVVSSTIKCDSDIIVVKSLPEAFALILNSTDLINKDIYLIGGNSIYKEGLLYADKLYVTEINREFEGDTYFVDFDESDYERNLIKTCNDNGLEYSFIEYKKIKERKNY